LGEVCNKPGSYHLAGRASSDTDAFILIIFGCCEMSPQRPDQRYQ